MIRTRLVFLLGAFALLTGCSEEPEVLFAVSTLERFATGDASVADDLDWDSLRVGETDFGTPYRTGGDAEKATVRTDAFAAMAAFEEIDFRALHNWRVAVREPGRILVIAGMGSSGRVLRVTLVEKSGRLLLSVVELVSA